MVTKALTLNHEERYLNSAQNLKYKMKKNAIATLVLATGILIVSNVYAQNIKIGDSVPRLEPYGWIKGQQVSGFEKGMVYVIEMGATWCKPCKAAIPNLSELATKYKGEVEVVSVFVQEINREPLNTTNPKYIEKVKKYVDAQDDAIAYNVAVDGPDKKVEKSWIDAMGRSRGVPQTFIINKDGKIAGHFNGFPLKIIDELVRSILEDRMDLKELSAKGKQLYGKKKTYSPYEPFFKNGNGGDREEILFKSVLAPY